MTRLEFWLKAKTAYGLHSPYMFALYCDVLSARLSRKDRLTVKDCRAGLKNARWGFAEKRYYELLFKLAGYFDIERARMAEDDECARRVLCAADASIDIDACGALPPSGVELIVKDGSQRLLLTRRHNDNETSDCQALEKRGYKVCVDLFDVVLFVANADLPHQYYMLRTGVL